MTSPMPEEPGCFTTVAVQGKARAGWLRTAHGIVPTPVFMPVGTQASVKSLASEDLEALDARIILGNTYHLALRPGADLVERMGGLHGFMAWPRAVLTDSGGFQVFSLGDRRKITEDGVTWKSHLDGSSWHFSPERAMAIQAQLGADITMAFDECPPATASPDELAAAVARTTRWAARGLQIPPAPGQLRFGIVQGATNVDVRRAHLREIAALPFDGLALGGLSVGEPPEVMHAVLDAVASEMPVARPRYLMGVGRPVDLLAGIAAGIDMFDCVMPTRNARNGHLFTAAGHINISNTVHRTAPGPIEDGCACATCARYSRAYLAHLYRAKELSFYRLATIHNLHHYLQLVRDARAAIISGDFTAFHAARRAVWSIPDAGGGEPSEAAREDP